METLGNYGGSAVKECDPKIVLFGWILHQSRLNSFLSFLSKYPSLTKNIASVRRVVGSLHSTAMAVSCKNLKKFYAYYIRAFDTP